MLELSVSRAWCCYMQASCDSCVSSCSQRPNVKPTRLEAWTTALRADIAKDGAIESKRLDIIIGPDAQNGKGASAWLVMHCM